MPVSTRILVVDSDATSQGDVQGILVSHCFVVLGGTDPGEETVTMGRAFQPQVILLNLDNGQESYNAARLVARECSEARLIAYSRRKDTESLEQSARVRFDGHPVKIVPAEERALLTAIESVLTGPEETPEEQAPVPADDGHKEVRASPRVDSRSPEPRRGGLVPPSPSGQSAEPFLRHFAEMASEWLLTHSARAEEKLLATLADDVQAPSFGGGGRNAVRRGLEGLAWRETAIGTARVTSWFGSSKAEPSASSTTARTSPQENLPQRRPRASSPLRRTARWWRCRCCTAALP
jgi:DNA-binding NarL/FixJ family response regulator